MARIPAQVGREVLPESGTGGAGFSTRASPDRVDYPTPGPEAFGAATGRGLENLGAGVSRMGQFFSQVAVDDQSNKFEQRANLILYGDPSRKIKLPDGSEVADTGYFGMQGETALNKRAEVEETLRGLAKEAGNGLLSPEQKFAYTRFTNNYLNNATARIGTHARNEERGWAESVQIATQKTQLHRIASAPDDEGSFLQARDDLRAASVKRLQLKHGPNPGPELVNEALQTADREAEKTRILSIGATDPNRAWEMTKGKRAVLGPEYDNIYLTLKPRADDQFAKDYVKTLVAGGSPIPAGADAKAMLRHFEGFKPDTYWDVNHHRTGYGSDTITKADGSVVTVKEGMTVTRADAERDLERRAALSQGQVKEAAGPAWDKLSESARASLTSVAYNYGSVPSRIVSAIQTGDDAKIAEAILTLSGDNNRVNAGRRKMEADFVMRGGKPASSTTHPVAPSEAGLIEQINNDPAFRDRPGARDIAIAQATRTVATFNADRAAQIKSLNDTMEATQLMVQLSPSNYKNGTWMNIAEGFKQAGDMSSYATAVFFAQNEEAIKILSTSPRSAQSRLIAGMFTGKAKALAEGLIAGTKEEATDAGRMARENFSAIKAAVEGKSEIPIAALEKNIRETFALAQRSGDAVFLSQVVDYVEAARAGNALSQLGPEQQENLIREGRERVLRGNTTNGDLLRLKFVTDTRDRQDKEFKDDAMSAGAKLYNLKLEPMPWGGKTQDIANALALRSDIANKISANRDGIQVSLLTNEEMEGLRNTLAASPPQKTEMIFRILSNMPADKQEQFAVQLAGQKGTGNFLSHSYAASMSLFSSKDPEDQAAASKILKGAAIRKNEGAKAPPVNDAAWQQALQDSLGNVFRDKFATGVPKVISDAIASAYTYDMFMAGTPSSPAPDIDVLNRAVKQVVGSTVIKRGQAFFPPVRGMTEYDVDKVLSTLTDADLGELRTTEGKPVTADAIRRSAQFSSIQDGRYMVRIPDGRNGVPSEILDYSKTDEHGQPTAFKLDMRPLVERQRTQGANPAAIIEDNSPMGMRRDIGRRNMPLPVPDVGR